VIEPIDPLERGELDGLEVTPRSFGSDHFGLEEADDGFSERIIVRVATAAHRRLDPGIGQTFRIPHRDVLRAAIAVMEQIAGVRVTAVVDRLVQGIEDEISPRDEMAVFPTFLLAIQPICSVFVPNL
jgi:hypothetical protein